MKVIFVQNVENIKVGEVKVVSDGYARNFLIPRGVAVSATPNEMKNLEKRLGKIKKEEAETVEGLENLKTKLEKTKIEISMESNEKDEDGNQKLFGSVTSSIIEEELVNKGFEIDKKQVEIGETIKEVGEYEITIKLGHGVDAKMSILVKDKKS